VYEEREGDPPQLTLGVSRRDGEGYKMTGEIFKELRIGFNAQILMKVNLTLLSFFLLTVCNEMISHSSHNKLTAELRTVPESCGLQPQLPGGSPCFPNSQGERTSSNLGKQG